MITVWSAKEGAPLYVLQAHGGPITQMTFSEEKQQIISCGKDKRIKVWQLPKKWMDEEKIINQIKQEKIQQQIENREQEGIDHNEIEEVNLQQKQIQNMKE